MASAEVASLLFLFLLAFCMSCCMLLVIGHCRLGGRDWYFGICGAGRGRLVVCTTEDRLGEGFASKGRFTQSQDDRDISTRENWYIRDINPAVKSRNRCVTFGPSVLLQ